MDLMQLAHQEVVAFELVVCQDDKFEFGVWGAWSCSYSPAEVADIVETQHLCHAIVANE